MNGIITEFLCNFDEPTFAAYSSEQCPKEIADANILNSISLGQLSEVNLHEVNVLFLESTEALVRFNDWKQLKSLRLLIVNTQIALTATDCLWLNDSLELIPSMNYFRKLNQFLFPNMRRYVYNNEDQTKTVIFTFP